MSLVLYNATKVAPCRAVIMPNPINPLYSCSVSPYKHLTKIILLFLTPPRSNPNLFSLKCASNVAIIIKSVTILMPMITSDVRWLLHALTEYFVCLRVDLFKIFHEPLIYKTKTWLVYVHLVLA